MKILLVGSTGMLGTALSRVLGGANQVITPSSRELDMTKWDVVIDTLDRLAPDLVVNCAGYTDIEGCESDEQHVRKINIEGPRNLAQGCARFECRLMHFSSLDVFDGRKDLPQPYFEDDVPVPLSAYGRSKLDSEIAVRENVTDYIIVRSGWIYDFNGHNFLRDLIRQAVQDPGGTIRLPGDQTGSPTWSYRLALQVLELIKNGARGTFHVTSEGFCTRLEYARRILDGIGLEADLKGCPLEELQTTAERPMNCLLENRRLKRLGIHIMPEWQDDLDMFLKTYGEFLLRQLRSEIERGIAA